MEEEASEAASFPRPPCPAYAELLEVMERAAGRLQLPWQREREETARGRLDERFLSGHNPVTPVSLPFLPDLHVEIEKAWKNPFSARIHTHQRNNFADVEGLRRHGSMTVGGVTFPLEQQSKDPQSVVYTGMYDTEGVTHTKSGERQPVQVNIQFTQAGLFETVWQVKFYNYNKRDHCQWGNSFNSIEYECKPNDTRTLMWINKELFL
ncbi:CB1 cannabinoid receptor-interacting protein 1 [Anabarilius grahami]|uniref:CB1 cannabinoid receptor-interacting protein 1 n=1 Tax=Anabarilius grahami TaxID=495550 RepID=A0A3N0YDI7_ANAGA|nr:CB1 cannabinoid receptor-interacting protein 1 [Anabarilius grahami]